VAAHVFVLYFIFAAKNGQNSATFQNREKISTDLEFLGYLYADFLAQNYKLVV